MAEDVPSSRPAAVCIGERMWRDGRWARRRWRASEGVVFAWWTAGRRRAITAKAVRRRWVWLKFGVSQLGNLGLD